MSMMCLFKYYDTALVGRTNHVGEGLHVDECKLTILMYQLVGDLVKPPLPLLSGNLCLNMYDRISPV